MAAIHRPNGTIEGGRVMKKIVSVMAMVAIFSLPCLSLAANELPPIPPMPEKFKNIQIVKVDSSMPKDITEFIGEWEGVWKYEGPAQWGKYGQEVRRAKLIIYEATSSGAIKVIYGVSGNPGGWRKYDTEISKDGENRYFSFFPPSGFILQFRLQNGLLLGRYRGRQAIEMKKVK
jgi:hypothetical protein